MPSRPPDEAFAQQLLRVGLATDAQIKEALKVQAEEALKGRTVPLGEIFVRQGLLTAVQRENIERKLDSQREEAKRLGPYRDANGFATGPTRLGLGGQARRWVPTACNSLRLSWWAREDSNLHGGEPTRS